MPGGTALGNAQLNATANVQGSFAYAPGAGEILPAGVHKLTVTFTPLDTLNYTTVRAVVSVTVTEKSPSRIRWAQPQPIAYGTALGAEQLNATASVDGSMVYAPAAGTVLAPGKYTLTASFTPADTEAHAPAHAAVELEVKGLPEIPSSKNQAPKTTPPRSFNLSDAPSAAPDGASVASETKPRETRTYKGAVYEKGEDGQWHLQKK